MNIDRSKGAECGTKQRHPTKQDAMHHRAALARGGAPAWRLTAYQCQHCKAWHVGHRPGPKRRHR